MDRRQPARTLYYRENGKENGNYGDYKDYRGNKRLYRDNIRKYMGSYRDNGKENGNYYLAFRVQGLSIVLSLYPHSLHAMPPIIP